MKKIMILGAGIYQVPLIKAAKRRGLYVIVVSVPGNYPGFSLADRVYYINTTDREAVLAAAGQEGISAIMTTGTDVAVSSIGYVCEKMGLPGLGFQAARTVTDKALMKQAFSEGGVTTAEFEIVHSPEEACAAMKKMGAPVMLKIVDRSGSRGITRVTAEEQMRDAYSYAAAATNAGYMLVERYIEGREIGVDAFVQNGEIKLVLPHDKLVYQSGRTGIPIGHICPVHVSSPDLTAKIYDETCKAVRAAGLDNCAVNMDVFITEDETVFVIETAGRCGATGIPEVISGYTGLDYYELIIRNALGEEADIPEKFPCRPALSLLLHSNQSGRLREVSYELDGRLYKNEGCAIRGRAGISLDYAPGDAVHAFENGTHRIGQAVFMADSETELMDMLKRFQKSLKVSVAAEGQLYDTE